MTYAVIGALITAYRTVIMLVRAEWARREHNGIAGTTPAGMGSAGAAPGLSEAAIGRDEAFEHWHDQLGGLDGFAALG